MGFVRRVITSTLDLVNLGKHNANFADIETDLGDHEKRIVDAKSDIVTHRASSSAHTAEAITYSGAVTTAESVQQAIDSVKTELTQAIIAGDSGPEAAAARASVSGAVYDTLGDRLNAEYDGVTAQLAETELYKANALTKLSFLNPYGNDQNIHPKVLDMGMAWNGYRYWMAYTPFPLGNDKLENPCIAVAENLTDWKHKYLLEDTPQPLNKVHYNNDTHLVYRNDTKTLECWWRYYNHDDGYTQIYRRTTTDGATWTEKQLLITSQNNEDTLLSPAVIFENNIYKMWYVNGQDYKIYYTESTDALTWGAKRSLNMSVPNITWWHLDVIKTNLGYELVIQGVPTGTPSAEWANMYYTKTTDNQTFSKPILIIKPSNRADAFDNQGIYRASLLKLVDGTYHLYYSAMSKNGVKGIGISSGSDISKLVGSSTPNKHLVAQSLEIGFSYLKEGKLKISDSVNAQSLVPLGNNALKVQRNNSTESDSIQVNGIIFDINSSNQNVGGEGALKYDVNTKTFVYSNGVSWIPLTPNAQTDLIAKSITANLSYLKDNELKLSNGVSFALLKVDAGGYLGFTDTTGKPLSLSVGGIKLDTTDTAVLGGKGTVRYHGGTNRFQGSDGAGWLDFHNQVSVPLSATATGIKGDYAVTTGFLYVCVATNVWQRVALASW